MIFKPFSVFRCYSYSTSNKLHVRLSTHYIDIALNTIDSISWFPVKRRFSFQPHALILEEEYIWMADLLVNLTLSTRRNLDNVMFRIQVNGYWKKNRLKGWFLIVVFVLVEMKVKKINRLTWQPLDCKKQDQSHGQSPICY